MAWALDWLFGMIPNLHEESEHQIAEQDELNREQEQINLISRRGEEVFASVPALPLLERQQSGTVLPCSCCPSSPSLKSALFPRLPIGLRALSPTWEEMEGAVILVLLNLLLWGVLWALFGDSAGPLSAPFYVIIMSLAGHAVGVLVHTLTPLPPLYGMLLLPAIAGNLDIKEMEVLADLRGDIAALIVYASMGVFVGRAGIDVDLELVQRSSGLVLALAFLPLFAETAVITLIAPYVLDISWRWAFLLGSLTSPMSPLVVMWIALELPRTGARTTTAVSSLMLAVCALDSAAAFCLFGVALRCVMGTVTWTTVAVVGLLQLPVGILVGAVVGFFSIYVPNEYSAHAIFYRVEMLLAVNVCSVIVFHYALGMPAVGYLSAFTTACVAANGWKTLSMDAKTCTLRTMMSLSWLIIQPHAMSIVGPHIAMAGLASTRTRYFLLVLIVGSTVRLAVSMLCFANSKRNWGQRCWICIACLPKGTSQLVSCSWTLLRTLSEPPDHDMAVTVMDCCVLALLLTGPLASLLAVTLAPWLLRDHDTGSGGLEISTSEPRGSALR